MQNDDETFDVDKTIASEREERRRQERDRASDKGMARDREIYERQRELDEANEDEELPPDARREWCLLEAERCDIIRERQLENAESFRVGAAKWREAAEG